jgi:hypothetical protein
VHREWGFTDHVNLIARCNQPVEEEARIAIELNDAARLTVSGSPSDDDRMPDLDLHIDVRRKRLLAAHFRPR